MTVLFFLLALLSEIIGTVGGFGSSVFFVPIASLFFSTKLVLGLTAVFHVFSNLSKIWLFKDHIDRSLLIRFGLPSIIGVVIGAVGAIWFSSSLNSLFLGIFLVIFSLVFTLKPELVILPTRINAIAGGGAAGFFAGLIGTGGAVRGAVMSSYNLQKNVFVATSATVDLGVDITRSVIYLGNDFVGMDKFWLIPGLIIVAALGSFIGKQILAKLSQDVFRRLVLILIGIIGIVSIVNYLYFEK